MYSRNQTLRHKQTNQLVALHPSRRNNSMWNWELDTFIDESGKIFQGNINDYTHIEDFLGRPCCGGCDGWNRKENKFVDVTLKKYLVSKTKKVFERKKFLNIKINEILIKLKTQNVLRSFHCDGDKCYVLKRAFEKFVKAKPLYKFKGSRKEIWHSLATPIPYLFKYNKRNWIICNDDIFAVHHFKSL